MSNTSATGGYLKPTNASPPDDVALQLIFTAMVVGVTGLDGELVRPRWLPKPSAVPAAAVDWCAVGVIEQAPDVNAVIIHSPIGEGTDQMQRHERLVVLASFYGPNSSSYSSLLRDGLALPQNREALGIEGIRFIECGAPTILPTNFNETWVRRVDLPMVFRRQVNRVYPVLNILEAGGDIRSPGLAPQDWTTE